MGNVFGRFGKGVGCGEDIRTHTFLVFFFFQFWLGSSSSLVRRGGKQVDIKIPIKKKNPPKIEKRKRKKQGGDRPLT